MDGWVLNPLILRAPKQPDDLGEFFHPEAYLEKKLKGKCSSGHTNTSPLNIF